MPEGDFVAAAGNGGVFGQDVVAWRDEDGGASLGPSCRAGAAGAGADSGGAEESGPYAALVLVPVGFLDGYDVPAYEEVAEPLPLLGAGIGVGAL